MKIMRERMERDLDEMGSKKPHVLVIPFPAQGHFSPALQLSKRLASKGLRVTFVTSMSSAKSSSSIRMEQIGDGYEEGEEPESKEAFTEHIQTVFSQSLGDIIEKQKQIGYPIKLVIYDSVMPWALEIAHKLGIYGAPFFTQPCAVCAIYYHMQQGTLEVSLEGTKVSLPSLPPLEKNDLPSFISNMFSHEFLTKTILGQFSNFHEADWILFNTFDKLEDEVVKWMASQWPIKTMGPTIPSLYLDKRLKEDKEYGLSLFTPNTEASMRWLDTKEQGSVVYVSFGSLAILDETQMEELSWGLLQTNNYFLWVVRASEESKLPNNFMAKTSEKGLVVDWCPQLEVLAHQAVGCFVTHCGWNSTLEALCLGVPMVAMPQWVDQTTNAKFVADVWKTGVRVEVNDKGIVTREEIKKRIGEVMVGETREELRNNASRWKNLTREAVDEGGSSDKNIEEFISKLVCS